jgi:uridine kinase
MASRIIGIAGGSGSGKSTLAINLCKNRPDKCALVHIDDYFKHTNEVPKLREFANFDHPDALKFDELYKDLMALKNGGAIKILTKSELYNPGYDSTLKNRIEYIIEPKEIIILEGYLALHDPKIRGLMDQKIYLDLPIGESLKRRSANKSLLMKRDYFEQVLMPMYKEYVLPTKDKSDLVIDVSDKNAEEVYKIVEEAIL